LGGGEGDVTGATSFRERGVADENVPLDDNPLLFIVIIVVNISTYIRRKIKSQQISIHVWSGPDGPSDRRLGTNRASTSGQITTTHDVDGRWSKTTRDQSVERRAAQSHQGKIRLHGICISIERHLRSSPTIDFKKKSHAFLQGLLGRSLAVARLQRATR
jgi:hypothetical protein